MSGGSTAVLADQTAEDVSSAHVFRIDGLPGISAQRGQTHDVGRPFTVAGLTLLAMVVIASAARVAISPAYGAPASRR
jgi:hypothetical protein